MSEAVKYAELGSFSVWHGADGFFGVSGDGVASCEKFEFASDCITFMDRSKL